MSRLWDRVWPWFRRKVLRQRRNNIFVVGQGVNGGMVVMKTWAGTQVTITIPWRRRRSR